MEEIHKNVPIAMKKKKHCDQKLQGLEDKNKTIQLKEIDGYRTINQSNFIKD